MFTETENEIVITFDRVNLIFSGEFPQARSYREEEREIFILGCPIFGEKIDYGKAKEAALNKRFGDLVKDINGSFLIVIYNKDKKELLVVNDRFASIPFYYRVDKGGFMGATNYSDIWRKFRDREGFRIREEAFFEFIYMKRLFGNKTYDRDTFFLNSASVLTYAAGNGGLNVVKYWRPNCELNDLSLKGNARELACLMKRSFKRRTSDSKRYGLLLSGGLDSRFVLAASDKPLVCFTTCEYENNEYLVARQISRIKGCEHLFIQKPLTYYSEIIDRATYLGSAMTSYENGHFLNIEDIVKDKVDVLLHGYGFDFLFRGKYLPGRAHPLLQKVAARENLISIGGPGKDIVGQFIKHIKFRLKNPDLILLIRDRFRKRFADLLYCEIEGIFNEARNLTENVYKQWNYCCFHNISRHYTWLNLLSIRAFIEERTVAFDNELFDFYWSLDPSLCLNGDIFINAVRLLNPAIFKIRNSNTNLMIGDPPFVTSAKSILNKMLKETGLNKLFKGAIPRPLTKERSWPLNADFIREREDIRAAALRLSDSGGLKSLNFLDMDAIRLCIKEQMERKKDHTGLIFNLITINRFLEGV